MKTCRYTHIQDRHTRPVLLVQVSLANLTLTIDKGLEISQQHVRVTVSRELTKAGTVPGPAREIAVGNQIYDHFQFGLNDKYPWDCNPEI